MARFFQVPNFRKDEYQRPEQKWVCGRACDGRGCPFGPTPSGACRTTGECSPVKEGDRWTCTRPDTHGGVCPEGPLPGGECCHQIGPCQPVLSLRARRGRWVAAAAIFTTGLLLVLVGGSGRRRSIDPGPLTSAHALSNTRCGDCHTSMGTERDAGFIGAHRPASSACLQCHTLGDHPLAPHGFDGATLASAHRRADRAAAGSAHLAVLTFAKLAHQFGADDAECTTCHKEHHGRGASLISFTNEQCQVCHQATFATFSKGHPDFGDYPFRRRSRIVFDHAKHMQVHFAEEAVAGLAPTGCNACHIPSATGSFMVVKGFEQACAACHAAQIEGEGRAGDKGIAFFRVPGLDAATLASKGHIVGDWPADADGRITPFTRLLLARDPAAMSALRTLGDGDLSDLRGAPEERLAAAEALAWSLKSLFADLVTNGQVTLMARLGETDPGADRSRLRTMTAQIPRDGLMAAQAAWFPNLFTEVANFRAGIRLAPAGANAPNPAAAPAVAAKPAGTAAAGDDLLAETPAPGPAAKAAPAKPAGNDLLGDDLAAAPNPAAKAQQSAPAPTKASSDDLGGDDLAAAPKPPDKPPARAAPIVGPLKMNDPESWAVAGGWYRSPDNYTLYYRPSGHADLFLTIWLNFAVQLSGNARDPAAQPLFVALSDPKGPGLCMKCHSVDSAHGDAGRMVNWHASAPALGTHGITRFNHAIHFSLLSQRGCQTCHQLRPEGAYLASFEGNLDPGRFESNFASISKSACAGCHNAKEAPQNCQLCHNYHTGEIGTKIAEVGPMKPFKK